MIAHTRFEREERPYTLCAWRSKHCETCNTYEMGMGNRVDHGCMWEEEIASHKTLRAARLHGGRVAKDGTPVTVYDGNGDAVWSL